MKKNRIKICLAEAVRTKRKLFCAYITAGFPSLSATEKLILGFEKIGVDLVEFGFPFSDPLADGPIIQKSSYQAIQKGTTLNRCFQLVQKLRKKGCNVPILFFSYVNPMHRFGFSKTVSQLKQSGFDGVICPDLSLGAEAKFVANLRKAGLSYIQLIAPNTPKARVNLIAKNSDDFVYYVSRKGITGSQKKITENLEAKVREIKSITSKPILVGFGISTDRHVRDVCRVAQGVIVGSAIVKKMDETGSVVKTLSATASLMQGIR